MRKRDESKKEAIFKATKELLNEIGFAQTSMSKIAKRAGVSAATIYVYFDNKDDMLKKLYLDVKRKMITTVTSELNGDLSIRQSVDRVMTGYLHFILENQVDYLFLEQFANSPLLQNLCIEEELPDFGPIFAVIEKGKREGILRQISEVLMIYYCTLPIDQMVKDHLRGKGEITEEMIRTIMDMSWNAIKE